MTSILIFSVVTQTPWERINHNAPTIARKISISAYLVLATMLLIPTHLLKITDVNTWDEIAIPEYGTRVKPFVGWAFILVMVLLLKTGF